MNAVQTSILVELTDDARELDDAAGALVGSRLRIVSDDERRKTRRDFDDAARILFSNRSFDGTNDRYSSAPSTFGEFADAVNANAERTIQLLESLSGACATENKRLRLLLEDLDRRVTVAPRQSEASRRK